VIVSGVSVAASAPVDATERTATAPEPAPVTPGVVTEKPRPPAPTDHTDPAWLDANVTVPPADSVEVTVPGTGRVRAGALPVEVGAAASGATPAKVRVRMLSQSEVTAAGGLRIGFELTRADGGATAGTMSVALDYSGIARAYGGDFISRIRLARVGQCPDCAAAKLVATNDVQAKRLVVDLPVQRDPDAPVTSPTPARDSGFGPQSGDPDAAPSASALVGGTTFTVASDPGGGSGDYAASSLSPSDGWRVGLGSGAFTYSYPITVPPAVAGAAPSLSFGYNSQTVDGRSTAANNQPGQLGEGWSFEPGYIERRFHSCKDENANSNPDLCWSPSNEYFLHFAGHSGELIKNGASNEWRVRGNDPAFRVLSYTGSTNGDNDGETFVVITPDGTKYWFGSGTEPRPSGQTRPNTNAAFTVPVVAGVNEPCYNAVAALSWCQQAYRWNLDRVRDPNDNVTSFFYTKELNYYARQGLTQTQYVRAGYLDHVEYGKRNGAEATTAPAQVVASVAYRCVAQSSCPAPTSANAAQYPDVPTDLYCPASTSCGTDKSSPVFFTTTEITGLTTYIWGGTAYQAVSAYAMTYTFPPTNDGGLTTPSLWLQQIQRTGKYGADTALPPVVFGGTPLQNRVNTGGGTLSPMNKYRIRYVDTETGGRVTATYALPHGCGTTTPAWNDNPTDCYPSLYNGSWIAFRKYLVTSLLTETTGGQPDQRVDYEYLDTPAWHYQDSILSTNQSWTDYRGHASVRVTGDPGGTTARTRTDYRLFRGMYGDKLTSTTAKTSYQLTDSFNNTFTDHHFLAGLPLEAERVALDGKTFETVLHRYWAVQTLNGPDGFQSHDTQYVRESSTIPRVKDTNTESSWITRQTDTSFASFSGMPTQVVENGDTSTSGDDTCTKLEATDNSATDTTSPNNTEWYLGLPYRATTYSGTACSGTILAKTESLYDGHALAATPTAGNLTQTDAYSGTATKSTTKVTYDAYGRVATSQSPNLVAAGSAAKTITTYSPSTGYPGTGVTVKDALGHEATTQMYFAWGIPKQITDRNAGVTRVSVDGLGRTTAVYRPDDTTTPSLKFAYIVDSDGPNRVDTSRLQSGTSYVTTYTYLDGLGRPIETQSPPPNDGDGGRVVSVIRYDAQGRKAAETQPMAATFNPGHDLVAPALSSIPYETRYAYDSGGRQSVASQYAGGVLQWSTTTQHFGPYRQVNPPVHSDIRYYTDVFGRLSRVDEFPTTAAVTTTYGYTRLGDLATITDAASHVTSYGYDWLRRRTSVSDPDTGASSTTYDADGNVVKTTDAKAESLFNVYDALDRKTDTYLGADATGTKVASWVYDTALPNGVGRLHKATRFVGGVGGAAYVTEATGYDSRGRPAGKKWTVPAAEGVPAGAFTYSYAYDKADHLTSVTMPAVGALAQEQVTTGYNPVGLPVTLTGAGTSYVSATTFRNDGRVAGRTIGIGSPTTTRAYTYDAAAGRLETLRTTRGTATIEDVTYGYDAESNVTSVADLKAGEGAVPQRECFRYDPLNRLTAAFTTGTACSAQAVPNHTFGSDEYDVAYAYNDLGDITGATTVNVANGVSDPLSYVYNYPGHAHAVASVGTGSYTYDANGATTGRPAGSGATGLSWNPLHQLAATTGPGAATFVYDADGNRLIRNDGSTAVLYLDGQEIAYTGGTAVAKRYYGNVAIRDNAGALTILLRNNQDSATTTVDPTTGTATYQRYLPYGGHRATPTISGVTQHGFLDKTEDPSGLVAVGRRYYDPRIGRFSTVDSLADLAQPQTLAGYTYGLGNPATLVDPTGLAAITGDGVGGGDPDCVRAGDCSQKYTETVKKQALSRISYMLPGWQGRYSANTAVVLGGGGAAMSGSQLVNAADQREISDGLDAGLGVIGSLVEGTAKSCAVMAAVGVGAIVVVEAAPTLLYWYFMASSPAAVTEVEAGTEDVAAVSSEVAAAEGASDSVTLFRHVSPGELTDIGENGFRAGPNSLGGKWFAESEQNARQWGAWLNPQGGSVVRVQIPREFADTLLREAGKYDGIGPARYVDPDQLGLLTHLMRWDVLS
jgi:RHS repeat-associated protein